MITDALQIALRSVSRLDGIQGVALQSADRLLHNQLPLSDPFATDLIQRVHAMMKGYASVGRKVNRLFISFGKVWLLIVSHGETRISVMTQQGCDLDSTCSAAEAFIRENIEGINVAASQPVAVAVVEPKKIIEAGTPVWQVKQVCLGILTKVMGQAQAVRLIEREIVELRKAEPDPSAPMPKPLLVKLSQAILDKVPNRARRSALADEFETAIQNLCTPL